MEREHKIKVVFNSKTYGIITIEEEFRKDKNETNIIKNVNTSLGMSSFPTAKLEINVTSKFPNLISIKTGDEVSIYGCEIDKSFEKLFQGVLLSVVVKSTKETIELVIESVSAFYFLQKRQLNYQNFINKSGLREILKELVEFCNINGKIEIDKSISNEFLLTPFNNFQALSLINAICYDLDLVYDFNKGDIMRISKRNDVLAQMHTSIPFVVDNDKIISSEFKQ